MIQRIQSIYLALAALLLVLAFFFPSLTITTNDATLIVSPCTVEGGELNHYFFWLAPLGLSVTAVLSLVTLGLFKNRKLQLKLCYVTFFVLLAVVILFLQAESLFNSIVNGKVIYSLGTYFPIAAIAFVILAQKAIKKDEDLIKSLDRIR